MGEADESRPWEVVAAYRSALAAELRTLRLRRDLTVEAVARNLSIPAETVVDYECARRRPKLPRLIRLCALYGVALFDLLGLLVDRVYPPGSTELDRMSESMILFFGLSPAEAVAGGTGALPTAFDEDAPVQGKATPGIPAERTVGSGTGDLGTLAEECRRAEWGTEPLGPLLRYRRVDDPVRRAGAQRLWRESKDASVRRLAARHKLAFGTVRNLLDEAQSVNEEADRSTTGR